MISVVVPTYNEEKNIESCLKSLLSQTLAKKEYEIIVVDGHSKDNTVKIAKRYADKVIMQKSKGVGGARNDGAAVAKGDIFATTDADCVVSKNWLETIKSNFDEKDVVLVSGAVYLLTKRLHYRLISCIGNTIGLILYLLGLTQPVNGCNMAVRTNIFKNLHGFRSIPVLDDYEISMRVKKVGKLKYDPLLYVNASPRRMEKEGILKVHFRWGINQLRLSLGKNVEDIEYAKQKYD